MLKRTTTLLILTLMLTSLLAACGGQTPQVAAPTDAPAAQATTAPAAATAAPVAEATSAPAAEPTAAPAAQPTAASAEPSGDASGIMTISTEQQATWVRNFNPFVADRRWPTREGIYEPLMVYNTIKGELVPWLGTEYTWNDDNTKLTFTTRDDVQWSDGTPFTAKDVVFTFITFRDKTGLQGPGSNTWEYLENVTAPNDTTVEFTFKKVFTVGLYDIATQVIVAEHIWKSVDDPVKFANENPVGTGPFTEVPVFQNQIYEVHRNPNYWQEGKPYIQGFRFPSYPGNDQANLATINGENDWAGNFIPDIENTLVAKDPENNHYWFPATGADVMLYLNTTKAPFDNVDVRKAISMAINREQIVQVAMFDYTHPADATGMSDAFDKWRNAEAVEAGKPWMTLNVEQANQMLDAAGLKAGADGIRTLADGTPMTYDINVVSGWTDWVSACQIMAQNLKAVGINVSVKTYDFSAWLDRVQKGEFDMSIGWSAQGATPLNFYRGQMSATKARPVGEAGEENWHRFVSEEADTLLDQFALTSDFEEQKQIAAQLQTLFVENAPALPLFPGPQWYEYNTARFEGFPNAENPYVIGSTYAAESILVMTEVKPKAGN
jgi:peptide/nickel transport system substrate-binding protein